MPTLAQVKDRVETDLDDATLQTILDAETEALEAQVGGSTVTETLLPSGLRIMVLRKSASSITSITERRLLTGDPTTLSSDDYRLIGSHRLLRLATGTNPASSWGQEVVVEYAADVDQGLRDRVILDLVQLSVEFRAFESEGAGEWSGDQSDYTERRNALLRQVTEGQGVFV